MKWYIAKYEISTNGTVDIRLQGTRGFHHLVIRFHSDNASLIGDAKWMMDETIKERKPVFLSQVYKWCMALTEVEAV